MTDLDFYAATVREGNVCGLGIGSTPDQWSAELGDAALDEARGRRLRRDFGLISTSFHRPKGEREWRCFAITVAIQRLAWGVEGNIPERLAHAQGPFRTRVPFSELDMAIRERGGEPALGESRPGFDVYGVPSSPAVVLVVTSDEADSPHRAGDVWSLAIPG